MATPAAAGATGAAATPAASTTPAVVATPTPRVPITVTAHSAHSVPNKFASMISPGKPAGMSSLASPSHHHSSSTVMSGSSLAAAGIIVAPPSHGGGMNNRFGTMLPMDVRQAIPASDALDERPDAARVYAGLTNGKAGREESRKRFWSACLASAPPVPQPSTIAVDALPDKLIEEIDMELESGHFSGFTPALSMDDMADIQHILQCEVELSERETYTVGSAHLCARLFLACERDKARTLSMLVLINSKIRPYTASVGSASSPLRTDVLLLIELLQAHPAGAELLAHLSGETAPEDALEKLSFDMVDLGDVVATWFNNGCFSTYFPAEFALRAIDLILLHKESEGAQACIVGLMLGLLLVTSMQIIQNENSDSLFGFLHELGGTLTKAQIGDVFAQAYWSFHVPRSKGTLGLIRKQADWMKIISQSGSGTIKFQSSGPAVVAGVTARLSGSGDKGLAGAGGATGTGDGALPAGQPPMKKHASGSWNLAQYSLEAGAARRSIAMQEGATGAMYGIPVKANASKESPKLTSSTPPLSSQPSTIKSHASLLAPHNDVHLLAELTAATGTRAAPVANSQQLLERALREIQRLEKARQATAANAGAAAPLSDGALHARAVAQSVSAMTPQPIVQAQPPSAASAASSTATPAAAGASGAATGAGSDRGILAVSTAKKMVPSSGIIRHSELLDYQSFPTLCMQGYLNKSRAPSKLFQRKGSTGFFGNLHRRFFVLQGSFLTYFKSHHDLKPTRDESLDLRTAVVTKIKNHEFAPFAFQISLRDKGTLLYLLFADNEQVREVWLECLATATQVPTVLK